MSGCKSAAQGHDKCHWRWPGKQRLWCSDCRSRCVMEVSGLGKCSDAEPPLIPRNLWCNHCIGEAMCEPIPEDDSEAAPHVVGSAASAGVVSTLAWSDGKAPKGSACGRAACECPEHAWEREHPKPEGFYVTVRLERNPRLGVGTKVVIIEGTDS